jgi:hypothetical protein
LNKNWNLNWIINTKFIYLGILTVSVYFMVSAENSEASWSNQYEFDLVYDFWVTTNVRENKL